MVAVGVSALHRTNRRNDKYGQRRYSYPGVTGGEKYGEKMFAFIYLANDYEIFE